MIIKYHIFWPETSFHFHVEDQGNIQISNTKEQCYGSLEPLSLMKIPVLGNVIFLSDFGHCSSYLLERA